MDAGNAAAGGSDPLGLLRHAISNKTDIRLLAPDSTTPVYSLLESGFLSIVSPSPAAPRIVLPKATSTRYRRPDYANADIAPSSNPEGFYDVQSLLCCFLNRGKPGGAYIQDATSNGCSWVSVTERKTVEDFLEGKSVSEPALVRPLSSVGPADSGPAVSAGELVVRSTTPTADPGADAVVAPPAKRQRYMPSKADQQAVRQILALHEPASRQVADRKSVLRGNKVVTYDNIKGLMEARLKAAREEVATKGRRPAARAPAPAAPSRSSSSGKKRPLNPIIIISPSSSAMLTMFNIKRFLEDAVFESPTPGPAGHRVTEDVLSVMHRRSASSTAISASAANPAAHAPDRAARYFVVDGVEALSKFGEEAWDRVVCVMTTGQEWQFRPYKWSDPKQLFHHVKGFFIQWTHDPPNPKVRGWNVTELRLDQSKRHIDKSVAADFWRSLEAWIAMHKPYLAY